MNKKADVKETLTKLFIPVVVFVFLILIKNLFFTNLSELGLTYFEINQIETTWDKFKGDTLYIIVAVLLSALTYKIINSGGKNY